MIGLIDCNNFFVSCERIFRPDLEHKPVMVLSNNDGCVIARSNEVKSLGIPMGIPLFKVRKTVAQHDIQLFSSNFALYGDISARVMQTLNNIVPDLEIYSIDEAFLDLSGIKNLSEFGQNIRQTILQHVGIPTSLGIAPTKTLAKIANLYAKKNPFHKGVCILQAKDDITKALKGIPVSEIWGIGRKTSESLEKDRIRTGWDFYQSDRNWVRRKYTVTGERLWMELHSIPCSAIDDTANTKKSIQVTRSFSQGATTLEELRPIIAGYASRAGEKLRQSKQRTKSLMVYIRTNRFRTQDQQIYRNGMISFPFPVYDDLAITKAACTILEQIFLSGHKYTKAGVILLDFCPLNTIQLDLFSPKHPSIDEKKIFNLAKAMDRLNSRFGRSTVVHGSCGTNVKWKDKKERVSPAYTTRWEDLPVVK